jgi:MFS family permease
MRLWSAQAGLQRPGAISGKGMPAMNEAAAIDVAEADAGPRRNAFVLTAAQAVSGSIAPIAVSLGGLTGSYLLGADKSLATLPVTGFNLGLALGAFPAAMLMRRIGRRSGFMGGTLFAFFGGLVTTFAIFHGSFVVFAIGMLTAGLAGSFAQQYRFAAADAGSAGFRARAISWVLAGGLVGAVVGPQTVIFTHDLFAAAPFAGSFLAISGLALVALFILSFLQGAARLPAVRESRSGGRPLAEIVRQPRFIVAVVCGMGAYGMMSLMMTAAPLAMVFCGLGENNAALGIQWHVLAMFAPSFVTGPLIARFGKEAIIATGMALLAGCAAAAISGIDLLNFWTSLVLLGVGWNFAFIGATAMLTETYRSEETAKVQGLNDFLVFGAVAVASFSSGKLFNAIGWEAMNLVVFPVVAICLLALATVRLGARRRAA